VTDLPATALSPAQAVSRIRRRGLALAVAVVALDQAVKAGMIGLVFDPPRLIEVAPFFNLVPVWNRGISFGLFNDLAEFGPIILTALALAVSGLLGAWLWRARRLGLGLTLGLVIGGAVGNVIDRVRFGAVVDFLDFHALGYHWPAFNVADSAITVGVFLMLLDTLSHERVGTK
jgi:signal peptidase II